MARRRAVAEVQLGQRRAALLAQVKRRDRGPRVRQGLSDRERTRPGGICLVSSRGPIPEDPPGYYWYPERGELKHCFAFAGWQVLATYEEESLHDGTTLVYRTGVIAQKPGA